METKITAPGFTFTYIEIHLYYNVKSIKYSKKLCSKHDLDFTLYPRNFIVLPFKCGNGWNILINLPTAYL